MSEIIDLENNTKLFKLDDPAGFSAFQMSQAQNNPRHLDRTEETRELKDFIINNKNHSQIIVQHGDSYIPLKNR